MSHAVLCAQDDVPQEVKARRLNEVIAAFRASQAERNQAEIGRLHLVWPVAWLPPHACCTFLELDRAIACCACISCNCCGPVMGP